MQVLHYRPSALESFVEPYNDKFDLNIFNIYGNSYEELCDNYRSLVTQNVTIGIPHNLNFYLEQFKVVPNIWHRYYFGRLETIVRMLNDGVIDKNKKHNISELYLPQEIKFYNHIDCITSVTTNNAVYHGIGLKKYHTLGLQESEYFNEIIYDVNITEEMLEAIIHNLDIFDLYIEDRNDS